MTYDEITRCVEYLEVNTAWDIEDREELVVFVLPGVIVFNRVFESGRFTNRHWGREHSKAYKEVKDMTREELYKMINGTKGGYLI